MQINEKIIRESYSNLTKELIKRNLTVTTMESMTGGQIASLITDTEGASAILKGAFVTYSNEAKILQGVPEETIKRYGVYSIETARAMAIACRRTYKADIGIGITGSSGNTDPNNSDSVPGQVYFAVCFGDDPAHCIDQYIEIDKLSSRLEYKLYAAEKIASCLFDILK